MSALGYSFEEALASLRQGGRSAAMSAGTIAIAFLTLGGFLLVQANVQRIVSSWMTAAELSVFISDDATPEARSTIEARIREHAAVTGVELVPKDEALRRFTSEFPELSDVVTTLAANPFPASFEVRIRPDATGAEAAEALSARVAGLDGVADVQYDRRWLTRLLTAMAGARLGAIAIAGVLMLGAAFTAAAVVRLSLHARRDEIDIMQLVGAPFSFIRGPFIVEGMLLGGIGALLALGLLWFFYRALGGWVGDDLAGLLGSDRLLFLGPAESLMLLTAGLVVGALAGTVASRAAR